MSGNFRQMKRRILNIAVFRKETLYQKNESIDNLSGHLVLFLLDVHPFYPLMPLLKAYIILVIQTKISPC